jgi:hypothetical protein
MATHAANRSAIPGDRRSRQAFYVGTAIVALAFSVVGFAPGIVDPSARRGPLTPLVTLHGAAMTGWLLLYLAQTMLARSGRLGVHRRLGVAGAGLAALVVILGIAVTVEAGRRGFDLSGDLVRGNPSGDFVGLLILPFGDALLFGAFVGAALLYRRRPEVHKRLMLLAVFGTLMGAPIAHVRGHWNLPPVLPALLGLAFFFAAAVHDRLRDARIHPVSLWGAILLVGLVVIRNLAAPSAAWHGLVSWLVG